MKRSVNMGEGELAGDKGKLASGDEGKLASEIREAAMKLLNLVNSSQNQSWVDRVKIFPLLSDKEYSDQVENLFWQELEAIGGVQSTNQNSGRGGDRYSNLEAVGAYITEPSFDEALMQAQSLGHGYNSPPILKLLEFEPVCLDEIRAWLQTDLKSYAIDAGLCSLDQIEKTWDTGLEDQIRDTILDEGLSDDEIAAFYGRKPSTILTIWDTSKNPWIKFL